MLAQRVGVVVSFGKYGLHSYSVVSTTVISIYSHHWSRNWAGVRKFLHSYRLHCLIWLKASGICIKWPDVCSRHAIDSLSVAFVSTRKVSTVGILLNFLERGCQSGRGTTVVFPFLCVQHESLTLLIIRSPFVLAYYSSYLTRGSPADHTAIWANGLTDSVFMTETIFIAQSKDGCFSTH